MIILTAADLLKLLPWTDLVSAVERAACAEEPVDVQAPPRTHLSWRENTFLAMPGVAEGLFGAKFVSITPGNSERGLPLVQGLMVLSSATTGVPMALLDAASLTALRTGAVGAVGLKYTTGPDVETIGVVGCGLQGAWQAIFACAVRPIRKVFCFNRSATALKPFTERVNKHAPRVEIVPCRSVDELLRQTDVIITATSSARPVLVDDARRLEGKHFLSIGSFKPGMQELPDAVYELAGHIVIDADAARCEVGDVVNPLSKGLIQSSTIYLLGQIIRNQGMIDVGRTTVFKSVGMALYDLFVAKVLIEEAQRRGLGRNIDLQGAL